MNEIIVQSKKIASQMQNMIPKDTYIQIALASSYVPKVQINTALTEYTRLFPQIMPSAIVSSTISDMMDEMLTSVQEKLNELQKTISFCIKIAREYSQFSFADKYREAYNRMLFLEIAEEIGFPVYLECDTELQDILIAAYRKNNNNCDKCKMQHIVMDYYNEDYIDNICNAFAYTNIFNKERVNLLMEGMKAYQIELYGAANSVFATQMSGMIRDMYTKLSEIHKFTKAEKGEVKTVFKLGGCRDDSEKVMLAEVISEQNGGIMLWYQVAKFFFNYIYKSGEKNMEEYPKRHMICHGIQTNYNTKEMSLKLILCMEILTELALRIEKMREDNRQMIIDV